jgi:plasmid stability protein
MGRPAQPLPKMQIRMTEEMKSLLQGRAASGFRSVNAEVIALIERGLAAEKAASVGS